MEHSILWRFACSGPHPGRHSSAPSNGALLCGRLAVFPTFLAQTSSTVTTSELAIMRKAAMVEAAVPIVLVAAARLGTKSAHQCGQRRSVAYLQIGNRPLSRQLLAPISTPARAPCAPSLPGPMPCVFRRVARAWRPHFKPRGVYYRLDDSTGKWLGSTRCAPMRPPSHPPAQPPPSY